MPWHLSGARLASDANAVLARSNRRLARAAHRERIELRRLGLDRSRSLRVQAPWQVQPGEGQERWRVHAVLIKRTLAVTLT